jgi:geranyl-CoA carboxylase alpha subunit
MKSLRTLLIANRGEIVLRIARSARAMGLRTVAVASDADREAPHARACDSTVFIGGERPAQCYLDAGKLLQAARTAGADALHPGYGFLSENAAFARAVIDAGLTWVGPPPSAIEAMADKARARRRMAAAGVPVLPGYDGDEQDDAHLQREAGRIGWPLMVKAACGGGGRGMRLVHDPSSLLAALHGARTEAEAAFGNGRLLLERALVEARHVEVQVFADAQGHVVHLGERDCSVQRRHQKLIEEAPSPAVDPALRLRLGEAAVRVAREIGYVGAGTVEFLLDGDGAFWFMEMNTRLQVEHPVTEALTGLDLVAAQLRVASGEPLGWDQDELLRRFESGGHAIEARLCAEDPARGFMPGSGRVLRWQAPAGVRCDVALEDGLCISPFYDSMLGKLIAHAPSRREAIDQLADALDRSVCLGVPTNRAFLARALRHAAFIGGEATTAFIGVHFPDDASRTVAAPSWLHALAATSLALLPRDPLPAWWSGWCSTGVVQTRVPLRAGERSETWTLSGTPASLQVRGDTAGHRVEGLALAIDAEVRATIDGSPHRALWVRDGDTHAWQCEGHELQLEDRRLASREREASALHQGAIAAPMHGRVVQVLAQPGHPVQAGALLLVMEAMKMEHRLTAPVAGTVRCVHAKVGEQVAARKLLVEIAP